MKIIIAAIIGILVAVLLIGMIGAILVIHVANMIIKDFEEGKNERNS